MAAIGHIDIELGKNDLDILKRLMKRVKRAECVAVVALLTACISWACSVVESAAVLLGRLCA